MNCCPASWTLVLLLVVGVVRVSQGEEPAKKAAPTRVVVAGQGYRVELDLSEQVLLLSVPKEREGGFSTGTVEASISPTLADIGSERFVSASVLAQKAKQFDDGLYASVELAAEQGLGRFPGKAKLLRNLVRALADSPAGPSQPVATVLAGAKLGLHDVRLPAACEAPVKKLIDEFSAQEVRSKPIGFYTWLESLSDIFRQDRMLQSELQSPAGVAVLAKALRAAPQDRAAYVAYLTLVSRLTTRLAYPDLRGVMDSLDRGGQVSVPENIRFFPPSQSHETELAKRLYGNRPIPEGFNLIEEMIRRIRSHQLSLKPTADSGWYDYQSWALEPLVVPNEAPEARHLRYDAGYARVLEELFKGILALTRETHVKQLEIPVVGAAAPRPSPTVEITIYPDLSVEPLASYYFRRAESYAFVRSALDDSFGREALAKVHRMGPDVSMNATLAEELDAMEKLFYGAHVTACRQIGMTALGSPRIGVTADAAAAAFAEWRKQIGEDVDVGRDSRMMVPVFYDLRREKTKVWVFLGWSRRTLLADFAARPSYAVYDPQGQPESGRNVNVSFHSESQTLVYPVMAEVYVSKILDREEFRLHCDRYKTRAAILANLK
jgi:hypothetical protein